MVGLIWVAVCWVYFVLFPGKVVLSQVIEPGLFHITGSESVNAADAGIPVQRIMKR